MLLKIQKEFGNIILARKLYVNKIAATRDDPVVIVTSHAFGA